MFKYNSKTKKYEVLHFLEQQTQPREQYTVHRPTIYENVTSQEYDEDSKRMVIKCKKQIVDNSAFMSHYKVSDFYLENVLAVGSPSLLVPTSLKSDVVSNIENITSQLDNIVKQENI